MTEASLFAGTPFALTATPASATTWCARPDALKKVRRIINATGAETNSALELVWANFGSGKSHVLYYLAAHLDRDDRPAAIAQIEMSERVNSFLELYKLMVAGFDFGKLLSGVDQTRVNKLDPNLARMASLWNFGNPEERELASRWLRAEKVDLRELRRLSNVNVRIEDERQALDVLRGLISLAATAQRPVVVLIDEFQRIGTIAARTRASIMSGLRTLFNQNPQGLTVVLAITSGIAQTAMALIPPELKTILGPRPAISLPEMSEEEAFEFCRERLAAHRPEGYEADIHAPFGASALQEMVTILAGEPNVRVTPRNLIHAMSWLYDHWQENGSGMYTKGAARKAMQELSWEII